MMSGREATDRDHATHALFVGDVTIDLTMTASHIPAPDEKVHVTSSIEAIGGVVANAAVACARTGATANAVFQVGDDGTASRIETALADRGVHPLLRSVGGRTSRVVVIIEPHGEKRLLLDPGVSLFPGEPVIAEIDLSGCGWVHTAVYGSAARLLIEKCRSAEAPWSLDLEPASFPNGIETIAAVIDGAALVFCNDRAAAAIGGDAVSVLQELGAKAVIRTRGARGSEFHSGDRSFSAAPPEIDGIVDTTGAGDCLAGWFIGETLKGQPAEAALRAAVTAATLSCRAFGAQDSYPTKAQVSEYLVEV